MIEILNYKKDDLTRIFSRSQINNSEFQEGVQCIIDDVRIRGNTALFEYISRFDKMKVNEKTIKVTDEEIKNAYNVVSPELLETVKRCKENILRYHKKQMPASLIDCGEDRSVGWIIKPVEAAGIYVPGGKAAYPSTVLMAALPAVAAGVTDIVMATPNPMPLTLVAADLCGIKTIYKMGGAHAIAALAYGTDSVKKVNVITGPGNVYVAMAKKLVYGSVNIDMIAGPSEILVIADDSANAEYVAADMLSQAEHDEDAASILITTSEVLAKNVKTAIIEMTDKLERKEIIKASLKTNGAIIIVKSYAEAVELSNILAPEHLEICTEQADQLVPLINNAGAIFVGNYSPEPLGDYYAGPSHTLPTSGTAKHFSVLSVDNYLKRISYINYSKSALDEGSEDIVRMARAEGLTAHANSILVRQK